MKSSSAAYTALLSVSLLVAACAPGDPTQDPASALEPAPYSAAADQSTPTAQPPAHLAIPGRFPAGKGIHVGDHSTVTAFPPRRALVGDRFTLGKFERPYNANQMDTYFPCVDIVSADFHPEAEWTYVRISVVGRNQSDRFEADYAVEIDSDMDGRGDLLLIVTDPAGRTWSTDRIRVFEDRNEDVGGASLLTADSEGAGDGYEFMLFDNGEGADADLAWARESSSDANSLEIAYKTALLGGDDTYLAGVWASSDALEPGLFDLNDHYTHEEAGAAAEEFASFYPIKGLARIDSTCRGAIGFVATGNEPAVCTPG